ncbi:hypothetical protein D3C83_118370 [compost metagenome]
MAFANLSCMNVPPTNSTFQLIAEPVRCLCTISIPMPTTMNATVSATAVFQYLMKSNLVP